ncbi:hypothetical protein AAFN85_16265 [Mucilaginibacter sp. CAU 1740]|uniref:hypothetical protein n=1 Tax=Mucilaginibacter sp. CAU 1740 TaxID=3140365 RepID=UPI00325C2D6A
MLTPLQQAFLEARTVLPPINKCDIDLLIISIGRDRGTFSHRHIETEGDTSHFVFVKDEEWGWQCVDRALQHWLNHHHMAALRMLEGW